MRTVLVRPVRAAWSAVLTTGAVLGTLCLVATVAFPLLGVRPLIFLSGSMSPAIPAGSLALAHEVDAADIEVGDIVTVPVNDTYVTHRVVDATHRPGSATLLLRGDGNEVADDEVHTVTTAPRTEIWVPHAGRAVVWFSHAPGVYVLAAWVALVLGTLRRKRGGSGGAQRPTRRGSRPKLVLATADLIGWDRDRMSAQSRRRARMAGAAMLATGVLVTPTPALAAWVDAVSATGTTIRTAAIGPTVVTCTDLGSTVRLSWTAVAGATQYLISFGGLGADRVENQVIQSTDPLFKDFGSLNEGRFDVYVRFGSDTWVSVRSNQVSYTKGNCG